MSIARSSSSHWSDRPAHSPGIRRAGSSFLSRQQAWPALCALATGSLILISPIFTLWASAAVGLAFVVSALSHRLSLEWPSGLLLAFVFLMSGFGRDFSHFHVTLGETPLYVTEAVLAVLGCCWAWSAVKRPTIVAPLWQLPVVFLALYVLSGLVRLPRDYAEFGLDAIRDAVLIYYPFFAVLAVAFLATWRRLYLAILTFWAGSLLASLLICWNAATGSGIETSTMGVVRYGEGIQALGTSLAALGGVSLLFTGMLRRARFLVALLLAGQLMVGIFLVQHRSLLLATLAGFLVVLLLHPRRRQATWFAMGASLTALAVILLLATGLVQTPESMFLRGTMARASTSLDPVADLNTSWRMEINGALLQDALDRPMAGAGFGVPISIRYGLTQYVDVDPHNSFVAIIYRLGFPAALCLFATVILCVLQTARAIRRSSELRGAILTACLAAFTAINIFACFNVVLEGPFLGMFYWLLLGLMLRFSITERVASR